MSVIINITFILVFFNGFVAGGYANQTRFKTNGYVDKQTNTVQNDVKRKTNFIYTQFGLIKNGLKKNH